VERLAALLCTALRCTSLRRTVVNADGALVDRAREAIRADDPAAAGLMPLAARLGVSPFRLSRAFTTHLGVSLTRYRNRVRVERALDRLEEGADDLAALAADLGFTDQAHLCRTMRQHLGHSPSAVRRLLAAAR
jgi:AraC-like DNA-binding protein